ncbi:hypothetical protein BDW02DRAFT_602845 [Decorospora gaudefroyi]|uniref:Uncharacterized protein n=1 Tax=Decorospora gaudefroyi TaxID=184978 RepID=A0A6A5JZF3_9PLEO|nr:hypothetical protein BDW02DRAFT_602845 [Decorospora gaudefroyi]
MASTLKLRLEHSLRHVGRSDMGVCGELTEKILRQHSKRQNLGDIVSAQRDEHRQRRDLDRRGIHYARADNIPRHSQLHRPVHHPSVADRQSEQLYREILRCGRRNERDSGAIAEGIALYRNLNELKVPVRPEYRLRRLRGLADGLMKWLQTAAETVKRLGPGVLKVNWCRDAFLNLDTFLKTEAEFGRIPDEWSKYRRALKEFTELAGWNLVNSTSSSNQSSGTNDGNDTVMDDAAGGTDEVTDCEEMDCGGEATDPLTAFKMSGGLFGCPAPSVGSSTGSWNTLSSFGASMLGSSTASAGSASTLNLSSSSGSTISSTVSLPGASGSKAPVKPASQVAVLVAAKDASQAEVISGTGSFSSSAITSPSTLASFFSNTHFKSAIAAEIAALKTRLNHSQCIRDEDVALLNRSCDWIISNAKAAWWDKDIDLEDDVGDWREKILDLAEVLKKVEVTALTENAKEVEKKIGDAIEAGSGDDEIQGGMP